MLVDLLQQGLVGLQVASTCVETYKAHEHIFVVGKIGDCLNILDMSMLVQPEPEKVQYIHSTNKVRTQENHSTYIVHTSTNTVHNSTYTVHTQYMLST